MISLSSFQKCVRYVFFINGISIIVKRASLDSMQNFGSSLTSYSSFSNKKKTFSFSSRRFYLIFDFCFVSVSKLSHSSSSIKTKLSTFFQCARQLALSWFIDAMAEDSPSRCTICGMIPEGSFLGTIRPECFQLCRDLLEFWHVPQGDPIDWRLVLP